MCLLHAQGLGQRARLVLIGGNSLDLVCWVQAAKRSGVVYSCLPESTSVDAAVTRVRVLGARLVYVSQGSSAGCEGAAQLMAALRKHAVVVSGGRITTGAETPLSGRQATTAPPDFAAAATRSGLRHHQRSLRTSPAA